MNRIGNGILKRIDKELADAIREVSIKSRITERMASRVIARRIKSMRKNEETIF